MKQLLARVRARQRRQLWAEGAAFGLSAALLLAVAGAFLGSVSPVLARFVLFLVPVTGVGVACLFGIFRTLALVGDDARTARRVGERIPALSKDLLAAVELERALEDKPDFSVELAHAFLEKAQARAERVDPTLVVDRTPLYRALAVVGVALVGSVALVLPYRATFWAGLRAPFATQEKAKVAKREPITGDIEISYRYPAYTGLGARTVPGTGGEIAAPKGTEVTVKTRADRDVERAVLVMGEKKLDLPVKGARDLSGRFILETPGSYHFAFYAGAREVARGPEIPIHVETDEAPKVALLTPGESVEVDPGEKVVLRFEASDDYGLTDLRLKYRGSRDKEDREVKLSYDEGRKSRGTWTWDLGTLKLTPGETLSYFVEAKDNDEVDGHKRGASRTHQLKVYSAAEHRREAVTKATQLWERLVLHLADRMEGPDRARPKEPTVVAAQQSLDLVGAQLAGDFVALAQSLGEERDAPRELWMALSNIGEGLHRKVRATSDFRKLYLRYVKGNTQELGLSVRFSRLLEEEIAEAEKDVLYLESLIDRQKLQDLQEMAKELARERRDLAGLMEQYKQTPDPQMQAKIMEQIQALRERIEALVAQMSELAKGIRDEHLNAEALKEMMEEKDLSSALDEVEKLMREGKTDEALAKLQELGMQMDEMLKNLDQAEEDFGDEEYSELAEKFKEFMDEVQKTAKDQKAVADQTREVRDRYKAELKERVRQLSQGMKEPLQKQVEELIREYKDIGPDPLNSRADEPLEEVQAELENLKNALKVNDFDLAAESADRADRAAQQLAMYGEQQRQLDQLYQNPPQARAASAKLADRLTKDAKKVQEVNQKLQRLFPEPSSMMTDADRQRLKQLSKDQGQVQKRAQGLQQKMDELSQMAPIFDSDAEDQLDQISQRMGSAGERLQQADPNRGFGEQKAAQDMLQQFQQQMQQNQGKGKGGRGLPLPMYGGGGRRSGWGQNQSKQDVKIPDADAHQAPKEFRQDLLDAMKQGAPEKYKDQVKRYYEELVK